MVLAAEAGLPADEFPPFAVLDLAALWLSSPDMPGVPNRLVLHTTESDWYHPKLRSNLNDGADKYDDFGHDYFPTWTVGRNGILYAHMSAKRTGRALLNPPGGVETNRWNVVQVEIVGWAANGWSGVTVAQRQTLRRLVWWCVDTGNCELEFPPQGWAEFPNAPPVRRFSPDEWRAWHGICGHQHVTENVHRDPGDFTAAEAYLSVRPDDDLTEESPVPLPAQTATETVPVFVGLPELRPGHRGEAVKELQNKLIAVGGSPGTVDAIYGPDTEAAVRAFKRAMHLWSRDADGNDLVGTVSSVVGSRTWATLLWLATDGTPPAHGS